MTILALTLNKRVVIQQKVAGQDAAGQPSELWVTFATVWANILFMTGKSAVQAEAASKEFNTVKASIRIRKLAGLTPAMRVVHGTEIYDIHALLPQPDNATVDLAVIIGANNG